MTLDKEFDPETVAAEPVAEAEDPRDFGDIMADLLAKPDADAADGEAAEVVEETPAEETPAQEPAAEQEPEKSQEEQPDEVHGEPPAHYTKAEKATLARIKDADTRQAVIEWRKSYERAVQPKLEAAAEARRELEPVERALAPFAEDMRRAGLSKGAAVESVFAVWHTLKTDPARGLAWIAENFARAMPAEQKNDLARQFASALGVEYGGADSAAVPADPVAAKAEAIVRRELDAFNRRAQQEAWNRQLADADAKIREFAEAKDAAGQLKRPHFDKVKSTMGALMQAAKVEGSPIDLETAYARAVRTRDDLPGAADGGLVRQAPAAAMGKTVASRARQASTPNTRSVAPAPHDLESSNDDFEVIMRRLIREGAG